MADAHLPTPRPFTRAQALENAAFLAVLRRTGNARAAARELGIHRATMTKRRARDPAFAAEWDAALAVAHARLNAAHPPADRPRRRRATTPPGTTTPPATTGEPRAMRTAGGRLQLRTAPAGRLTRAHEQAFLAALSATANVRLSARAAGFSHSAFYARRNANPGFAREMRIALEMGYDRVEMAVFAAAQPEAHADDAWRHNDPPPVPPMTPSQALLLLCLHQKTVRFWGDRADRRPRPGEPTDAYCDRLRLRWTAEQRRMAEDEAIAARLNAEPLGPSPHEPPPPALPALDQVTGWSKADPTKSPHHPGVALFGGWRLEDWQGNEG